ncbi:MAG: hypothetical protein ACRDP6_47370 [Actinoallomurus sp.]
MTVLDLVLYLAGVICFVLAAINVTTRPNLIGLGLACVFAVPLIHTIAAL